jgi:amino acid transporter
VFFVGSALCIGIVIPSNDSTLIAILDGDIEGGGTGAAS